MEGGRWKPAHYWLKDYLFTDRIITCGEGRSADTQLCYVRNDVYDAVIGNVLIYAVDLTNSAVTVHYRSNPVTLASGPGTIHWFDIPAVKNSNSTILKAVFIDSVTSDIVARNTILFTIPQHLTLQPVQLTATVSSSIRADASVDVYISKQGAPAAVWVTLTTQAQGRFSDNAFVMEDDEVVVQFIPFGPLDTALLQTTLRVETANDYASSSSSSSRSTVVASEHVATE